MTARSFVVAVVVAVAVVVGHSGSLVVLFAVVCYHLLLFVTVCCMECLCTQSVV